METAPGPHVLVIPFPAQGHALPLLDLAGLLAARGLRLTVATTPPTSRSSPPSSPRTHHHPPPRPPVPTPPVPPPGRENTKGCGPEYFAIFIHALTALRDPIRVWANSQPDPVAAVLADFFCGWAQPLAAEIGAAGLVFSPSGVLGTAVPHSLFRRLVTRPPERADDDAFRVTFPGIPGAPAYEWRESSMISVVGFVSNTLRALEGRYLDAPPLEDLGFSRVWAVGPVAPETAADARGG
ncbi:hypothetical protein PR202_ga18788 [Eleusine coracana subsp. coracana]|uniref:Uncharacterized protein n=1 Tax=Eleusine coracana subsp. coracana TaxID=191504 RepID=A0AAV5CU27_ELECO|nr:hypothetical protein PR202_ga18788 [Eleusine coracana subsp. coracana]